MARKLFPLQSIVNFMPGKVLYTIYFLKGLDALRTDI